MRTLIKLKNFSYTIIFSFILMFIFSFHGNALSFQSPKIISHLEKNKLLVYDFEIDKTAFWVNTFNSGTYKLETVYDPEQKSNVLKLDWNSPNKKCSLVPQKGFPFSDISDHYIIKGIGFLCKSEKKDFNISLKIQGTDVKNKKGRWSKGVLIEKGKWNFRVISLSGMWSKTKNPPDPKRIKSIFLSIPTGTLYIDDICIIVKEKPFNLKPIKKHSIYPVKQAPVINGKDDDNVWKDIDPINLVIEGGRSPKNKTDFRLCYDNEAIYVMAKQYYPQGESLKKEVKNNDGPVYNDDSIEMFFDPTRGHSQRYQLDVNSLGTTFDLDSAVEGAQWNPSWKVKTSVEQKYWIIEAAIPFNAFNIDKPEIGEAWGFNVKRLFYGNSINYKEHSWWSTSKHSAAADFGNIVFSSSPSHEQNITRLILEEEDDDLSVLAVFNNLNKNLLGIWNIDLPGSDKIQKIVTIDPGQKNLTYKINYDQIKSYGKSFFSLTLLSPNKKQLVDYTNGTTIVSPKIKPLEQNEIVIWPFPKKLTWGKDGNYFNIAKNISISSQNTSLFPVDHFISKMKEIYGISLKKCLPGEESVTLEVNKDLKDVKKEGYKLSITTTKINLQGKDERGLYYGVRTLLSIIYQSSQSGNLAKAKSVEIIDYPDLAFRALYCRCDFRNKGAIFNQERLNDFIYRSIAGHKLNYLILNMRDAFKYKSHPKINNYVVKQPVSENEIKEIVDFAKKHYVEIIPGGNTPGHCDWIVSRAYPELREDGDSHTLCTSNPKTLPLLFDLYGELIDAMPSKYFHAGHDEVRWKTSSAPKENRCRLCAGKEKNLLLLEEMTQLNNFFKDKGMRMIVWNDMFLKAQNGMGKYNTALILDKLPRDIIMMRWSSQGGDGVSPQADLGFDVIFGGTGIGNLYHSEFLKTHNKLYGGALASFSLYWPYSTAAGGTDYNHVNVGVAGGLFWNKETLTACPNKTNVYIKYANHINFANYKTRAIHSSGEYSFLTIPPKNIVNFNSDAKGDKGWFGAGPEMDFADFPTNNSKIGGIPFQFSGNGYVADGVNKEIQVQVSNKISSFYIMHTAYARPDFTKGRRLDNDMGYIAGEYIITYKDGTTDKKKIYLGYNIGLYYFDEKLFANRFLFDSRWTWIGKSQKSKSLNISAQLIEVVNNYPEKEISSIKLVNMNNGIKIVLLGITADLLRQ